MLSLIHRRCAGTPVGVLLHAVERLADVVARPMGDIGIRLDLDGPRPCVWLNPRVSDADLGRFLPEVLAALVIGPAGAPSAHQSSRLTAVG